MKPLAIARPGERLSVLCLGAHSDDIEIGAGGTLLTWMAAGVQLDVTWCVLSAGGVRGREATQSAERFLERSRSNRVVLAEFDDGLFPDQFRAIKTFVAGLRSEVVPDVVLTHRRDDAHQDHRTVCDITWNLFRDHLVLEYEIPKWDGDLGRPSLYVPISAEVMDRKVRLLEECFGSQRSKDWFDAETFRGLARLRGMECRAPDRYAEAFVAPKVLLGI